MAYPLNPMANHPHENILIHPKFINMFQITLW